MPGKKNGGAKPAAKKTTGGTGAAKPAAPKPREPGGGRALIVKVLNEADRPVHVKLIAERVLKLDRARPKAKRAYNGKTPEQTISAALTVSHNSGGPFVKTEPGVFALRAWNARTKGKSPDKPEPTPRAARKANGGGVDPQVAAHSTVISEGRKPNGNGEKEPAAA